MLLMQRVSLLMLEIWQTYHKSTLPFQMMKSKVLTFLTLLLGFSAAANRSDAQIVHDARVEGAISPYYASPVAGDGKLYTASQPGEFAVIQAGQE